MPITVTELDTSAPGLVMTSILENTAGVPPDEMLVCVGDTVTVDDSDGYLRGHGTCVIEDNLISTVCGAVERVNKLVSVRPLKSRYNAELGDVVISRVADIQSRRWVMELGAQQQASLQLSAVNLPGGVQRRRNADDELNMRQIFQEGDLVSCEVQQINRSDKSINLHTRSNKYGLLKVGQLVQVPARLIKRSNSHFVDTADSMVRLIIGCNGWLWVGMIDQSIVENPNDAVGLHGSTEEEAKDFTPAAEQFEACARYANAALGLARLNLAIYKDSLAEAVKLSVDDEVSCGEMLGMDFLAKLVMLEEARRGGAMDTS